MILLFASHVSCEVLNLTSFSVISDPNVLESVQANIDAGVLDRMVVNEPHVVYIRMYIEDYEDDEYEEEEEKEKKEDIQGLVIMKDNDILQTKYIAMLLWCYVPSDSLSIGNSLHIVIENVTQNMGTGLKDAMMDKDTTIIINDEYETYSYGIWTSTIEPDDPRVELNCKIVKNNGTIVTAKCITDTDWPDSVFNRIPIYAFFNNAFFGGADPINYALFGKWLFSTDEYVPYGWSQYNVSGYGSNLTINDQVTIMGLPESFVSYWVDTIHAKAMMGRYVYGMHNDEYVMLVPPGSS